MISIIIPVYNEEKNLPKLLQALSNFIDENKALNYEIVFVNDGSVDATEKFLRIFEHAHKNISVISYSGNKGKGHAVRIGMLRAKGKWKVFFDADLAVPIIEIKKLYPYLEEGIPVIIGSRVIEGASIIKRQPWYRRFFGANFTILANVVTRAKVSDYTCGFKCFSAYAAQKIFETAKINRWAYDAEILFLARKYNFEIKEIPVIWENGNVSKVVFFKDTFRAFIDLLKIKKLHKHEK